MGVSASTAAQLRAAQLPATQRRVYGHGAVLALVIPEAQVRVGITLAGEREDLGRRRADGVPDPGAERIEGTELTLAPERWLDWVSGQLDTDLLVKALPAWASRNVTTALSSVRRVLKQSAVPAPPPHRAP